MYITNLTKARLGINGIVVLNPGEVNHYINVGDPTLEVRLYKMQEAGLVSIVKDEGLTKINTPAKAVKLLTVDEAGVTKKPRSTSRKSRKKVENNEATDNCSTQEPVME